MADIAARFTHMGAVGSGLAAKMLNQLIVGAIHVVMAEAASMAEAAGIDAARLPECLAGGHADGALLQRLSGLQAFENQSDVMPACLTIFSQSTYSRRILSCSSLGLDGTDSMPCSLI